MASMFTALPTLKHTHGNQGSSLGSFQHFLILYEDGFKDKLNSTQKGDLYSKKGEIEKLRLNITG